MKLYTDYNLQRHWIILVRNLTLHAHVQRRDLALAPIS